MIETSAMHAFLDSQGICYKEIALKYWSSYAYLFILYMLSYLLLYQNYYYVFQQHQIILKDYYRKKLQQYQWSVTLVSSASAISKANLVAFWLMPFVASIVAIAFGPVVWVWSNRPVRCAVVIYFLNYFFVKFE